MQRREGICGRQGEPYGAAAVADDVRVVSPQRLVQGSGLGGSTGPFCRLTATARGRRDAGVGMLLIPTHVVVVSIITAARVITAAVGSGSMTGELRAL